MYDLKHVNGQDMYSILLGILLLHPASGLDVTEIGCSGSNCYKLVNGDKNSFFGAGRECTDLGAHLATLEDQETHLYVISQLFSTTALPYLGITDIRFPWRWVTGGAFSGIISRGEDEEERCDLRTCGIINFGVNNFSIEAVRCDEGRNFICHNTGAALNINNVQVSLSSATWFSAREDCKRRGLDLFTFDETMSQAVNNLLRQKIGSGIHNYWIGLYARKWVWSYNGQELQYSRFASITCHNHFILSPGDRNWRPHTGCCSSYLCQTGSNVSPVVRTQGLNVTDVGCVGGRCYKLVLTSTGVLQAGRHCQALGGAHLATVPDEQTNLYLFTKVSQWGVFTYIGALAIKIPWSWITGKPFLSKVEPTLQNSYYKCNVNTCGSLTYQNDQPIIKARQCWKSKGFICRKPGSDMTVSNVYISLTEYPWHVARSECIRRGMILWAPDAGAELSYDNDLKQIIQSALQRPVSETDEFWMGIYSLKYVWIYNGEEIVNYINVKPVDSCDEALAFDYDNTWYRRSYSSTSFLCESGSSPIPTYGISSTGLNVTSIGCVSDRCYWLILTKSYWSNAGTDCNSLNGAHVGTIPDEQTNLFVLSKTIQWGVDPYLGAVSINIPWTWVDGSRYNGNVGNSSEAINTCAMVQLKSGIFTIMAGDCQQKQLYLCRQKGVPLTPGSIIIGQNPYPWHVARHDCIERGLDLFTYDEATSSSLSSLIPLTANTELWVGLYRRKWIWIHNRREVTYTRFYDIHHDKDNVVVYGDGDWKASTECCHPILCETGGDASLPLITVTPKPDASYTSVIFNPMDGSQPPGPRGVTQSPSTSNETSFDPILHAVVPAVAAAVCVAVIIVILCLYWRKAACFKKKKDGARKAHDNLAVGGPVTYVSDPDSSNYYTEITEPPDYQGLDPDKKDHYYESLPAPKTS